MIIKLPVKLKQTRVTIPTIMPEDYTILWKGRTRNDLESGLTCSMLYNFLRCRVLFLLALNRWTLNKTNSGLAYGNLFHHLLEKVYSSKRFASRGQAIGFINGYISWKPNDFLGLDAQEMTRIRTLAMIMLDEYQKFYADDFIKYNFETLEGQFDVEWNNFRLRGKRDGLVRDKSGRKLLWENKNFWQISSVIEEILQFDLQNNFYVLANDAASTDASDLIMGIRYNITRVPQDKVKDSLTEYEKTIREKVQADPKYYFVRYEITYTENEKRRFAIELMKMCNEIQDLKGGKLEVYKNCASCEGKYKCKFIHACSTNSLATYIQDDTRFPELNE